MVSISFSPQLFTLCMDGLMAMFCRVSMTIMYWPVGKSENYTHINGAAVNRVDAYKCHGVTSIFCLMKNVKY